MIISDELSFKPGTKGQYSNSGFILLGAIIEAVTGQTYYKFVEEQILTLLRMSNTGFFSNNEPSPESAVGYFEDEDDNILKNNLDLHGNIGSSAGGAWATASDMHVFMRALATGELVSAKSFKYLTTPNHKFEGYGYGIQLGKDWIGHYGGFPGIEAFVMYYPKTDHTIIVFSNYFDSSLPFLKKRKFILEKISEGN